MVQLLWRNWLARWACSRRVGGSKPPRSMPRADSIARVKWPTRYWLTQNLCFTAKQKHLSHIYIQKVRNLQFTDPVAQGISGVWHGVKRLVARNHPGAYFIHHLLLSFSWIESYRKNAKAFTKSLYHQDQRRKFKTKECRIERRWEEQFEWL